MSHSQITTDKQLVGPWVFKRINRAWGPDGRQCIGLLRDGQVVAGVVFEDWTLKSVTAHVAISDPHAVTRKFIAAVFYYAFIDLGAEKMLGFVKSSNTRALRLDVKLGFRPEAIIEDVFPDGDLVIMVLNRSECRFIPKAYRAAA